MTRRSCGPPSSLAPRQRCPVLHKALPRCCSTPAPRCLGPSDQYRRIWFPVATGPTPLLFQKAVGIKQAKECGFTPRPDGLGRPPRERTFLVPPPTSSDISR